MKEFDSNLTERQLRDFGALHLQNQSPSRTTLQRKYRVGEKSAQNIIFDIERAAEVVAREALHRIPARGPRPEDYDR